MVKLNDVRKLTIKKQLRVRFALANGMECIVNEHGLAKVSALQSPPSFNLEEEFSRAPQFVIETVGDSSRVKDRGRPQTLSREQLEALTRGTTTRVETDQEHED
jgi:hypothetical protein